MVYIKYPLLSLDNHPDLVAWRQLPDDSKRWVTLRAYLNMHLSVPHNVTDYNPKCWYTEMEQLDINAQDVEHFRPKGTSVLLVTSHRSKIERIIGYSVPEDINQGDYFMAQV